MNMPKNKNVNFKKYYCNFCIICYNVGKSGELWVKVATFLNNSSKSGEEERHLLIGEYYHSLDEKGRVNFPAKLREELGDSFVITKGLDGCLSAYSMEKWELISEKVSGLPQAKARDLKRFMFSAATVVNPDKQGRVLLSPTLRLFGKIEKDVAVIGAGAVLCDGMTIEEGKIVSSDDIKGGNV